MGILSLLVPLVFLANALRAEVDPLLPFSEYLDAGKKVHLRWGFDMVKDSITFEVKYQTTGWVGFGFSPNGGMTGSDIVIGLVGTDGIHFTDRHGVGNTLPVVDERQDYNLICLTEADGHTVMKFQRSISACDVNDFAIKEAPVKLIYAYGESDTIGYHSSQRGTKELNLLNHMPAVHPPDSKFFDITMANFSVPTQSTYYHCRVMNLPQFDRKYHIYRVEPLIEHVEVVHHLLMYRCPHSVTEPYDEPCYEFGSRNECYQVIAAWGVGGGAFEFPEAAGIPVGDDGGKTLYRLEVHYNNPSHAADFVDNSGLRFFYTGQLRQHDAAVLQTGLAVSPGYAIPPNASAFIADGLCDTTRIPEIISQPAQDMQVFAVLLHTHLVGRKVRVGHFRDNAQIDFLAINDQYDFEYQEVVNLGKTKTIKIGDKVLVQCTYDTRSRQKPTWGGLSTTNEMCLAFLFYYPATDASICGSLPDNRVLSTEMGAANETEWVKLMFEKKWDEKAIAEYQHLVKTVPQHITVVNIANNASYTRGMLPELNDIPPVSCEENSAEFVRPAVGTIVSLLITLSLAVLQC